MKKAFDKPPLEPSFYNLPEVGIELIAPNRESKGTFKSQDLLIKDKHGEVIGHATVNVSRPKTGEPEAYLNTISINEELRGQGYGYGKAAYLEIIKMLAGIKLKTKNNFGLSRGTFKVWEWLCLNGIAVKTAEGKINDSAENIGYSTAEYETI